jgi:hypothetical protein
MANFTSEIIYLTVSYEWHTVKTAITVMGRCNVWFKNGSAVKQRNVSTAASGTSG